MSKQYPAVDPDGLLEYSVVFTDRALNHMSALFQGVMRDLSQMLKDTYKADAVAIVPGGGSYGMEAVARQLATGQKCLVLRNGWFSYRWSQIFDMGQIPSETLVLKAKPCDEGECSPYQPAPLAEVLETIAREKPQLVFAPHVETASGMVLPDAYLRAVGDAVHAIGGLFVLDCVASGALWVDMPACAVDVLISAPQKGWSASPCAAFVMLSEAALARVNNTTSSSFACDLRKWLNIMQSYEAGGFAYHATMPTDTLYHVRNRMAETIGLGLETLRKQQIELGQKVRALLARYGYASVAHADFAAPGVVVCYTQDDGIHNTKKFVALGLQTAAGVPLMCDEPSHFKTFRIGLFGLDKWQNIDNTVANIEKALQSL